MMTVPFLDVTIAYEELRSELDDAYRRVMKSGRFILGEEVAAFEAEFAAYCGTRHCIGVGNGLEALHLILRACGIGSGDEVIVPSNTFIATWLAVSHTGAMPVPVEPAEGTHNLDPGRLESAITERTRAVIPVHLYGQPADMDPIVEISRCHGLTVIEDAAQAHGGEYKGRRVGVLGDAAAFSFYPAKNLGAFGDGGAIVTDDDTLAHQVLRLRNYGSSVKYDHQAQGFNSRLDALQAAFLRAKLRYLDNWNERRREVASYYLHHLSNLPGLLLPTVPDWADPAWHLFVVRHAHRDALQEHLARVGVGAQIHYPIPPHLSGAYAESGWKRGDFPIAERLASSVLSLPMGPHLAPREVESVLEAVVSFGPAGRSLRQTGSATRIHA